MISVKICGITNAEDADLCIKAGARALGFVFYGLSPRAIALGAARDICRRVPASVKKVGVFVNAKRESVLEDVKSVGLDMAQLSGDETVSDCQWLASKGVKVVKAIRPRTLKDVAKLEDYKAHVFAFNVDAFKDGEFGGTGTVADWALATRAKEFGRPLILAGGLQAGNVLQAIKAVGPSALDICSGVESEPGKKDPRKVQALFKVLAEYDDGARAQGGAPTVVVTAGADAAPPEPEAEAPEAPDASEPGLVDYVERADRSAAIVLPPAGPDEPPLVDWASQSAAVKKPEPPPPPGPIKRKR